MTKVYNICSNSDTKYGSATQFLAGTEYEIESVQSIENEDEEELDLTLTEDTQWKWELGWMKDGSLRNNGLEVVTQPLSFSESIKEFERVHNYVKVGDNAYSHRTSTHVHVNVQNFTLDQVKTMMLLYALYEQTFFDFVGKERQNNIHCVPLNYTYLPSRYSRPLVDLVEGWSKYTAFNLLPVRTLGTVEFRHLGGTGNLSVYYLWLQKLKFLWDFVYSNPDYNLYKFFKNGGDVIQLGKTIFKETITKDSYKDSIIDVKLAFV